MQSGVISSENAAQILRNIAQKRQNGSLDIMHGDEKQILIFSNGKIADAYLESENVLARAARRMDRLAEDCRPEILKEAVKHDVLNFLFDMDLSKNCIYEFRNYMPEIDRDLAANISVGQFLLDKASLDSELKRFNQIFQNDSVLIKFDAGGLDLSDEEKLFYDSIPERATLQRILETTYHSRYHTVIYLLSFYERALIEIEKEFAAPDKADPPDRGIIDVLEDTSARRYVEKELSPGNADIIIEKEVSEKLRNSEGAEEPEAVQYSEISVSQDSEDVQPANEKTPAYKVSFDFAHLSPLIVSLIYITAAVLLVSGWGRYTSGF